MNSIESNALEPTKDELAGLSLGGRQIVGVVPDGF